MKKSMMFLILSTALTASTVFAENARSIQVSGLAPEGSVLKLTTKYLSTLKSDRCSQFSLKLLKTTARESVRTQSVQVNENQSYAMSLPSELDICNSKNNTTQLEVALPGTTLASELGYNSSAMGVHIITSEEPEYLIRNSRTIECSRVDTPKGPTTSCNDEVVFTGPNSSVILIIKEKQAAQ